MEERDHELWESVTMNETQPLTGDAIIQANLKRKREGYKKKMVLRMHELRFYLCVLGTYRAWVCEPYMHGSVSCTCMSV